jgi:MoxR-like ATPase
MSEAIQQATERIKQESAYVELLMREIGGVIVGQKYLIERLMIGLLTGGHVLLEGVPGLAKTTAVRCLADAIRLQFQRLQFTPDLLPADLIGTMIYDQKTGEFYPKKGPVFSNLILADEINRAPAKVQSALLEAMQERQVTLGGKTYPLPSPFLVLATQNPIEQEGTYPLPEAQVDRFMLKVKVTYPSRSEERQILDRMADSDEYKINAVIGPEDIERSRQAVREIYVDPKIRDYIIDIVFATRDPEEHKIPDLKEWIQYGASPRASIYLIRAARAPAFLRGRGYVPPEDVKSIGPDILRHRVIVTYEAEADEITSEDVVQRIFDHVDVP